MLFFRFSIGCWVMTYTVLDADDLYLIANDVKGNCGGDVGG